MSLAVDIFREIANPNSTDNAEAQRRLRLVLTHEKVGPALIEFMAERSKALGNFALAAISFVPVIKDMKNIEAMVADTPLQEFGEVFLNLARGHPPTEIVSSLGCTPEEVGSINPFQNS